MAKIASLVATTLKYPGFGYLRRALDADVSGYLLKDAPSDRLADAIRRVHGSMRPASPAPKAGCNGAATQHGAFLANQQVAERAMDDTDLGST